MKYIKGNSQIPKTKSLNSQKFKNITCYKAASNLLKKTSHNLKNKGCIFQILQKIKNDFRNTQ